LLGVQEHPAASDRTIFRCYHYEEQYYMYGKIGPETRLPSPAIIWVYACSPTWNKDLNSNENLKFSKLRAGSSAPSRVFDAVANNATSVGKRNEISVIVITKDEEGNIERALLVSWATKSSVVDSQSSDRTLRLRVRTAREVSKRRTGRVSDRRRTGRWRRPRRMVLSLDADERVTLELREEIVAIVSEGAEFDAYAIRGSRATAGSSCAMVAVRLRDSTVRHGKARFSTIWYTKN